MFYRNIGYKKESDIIKAITTEVRVYGFIMLRLLSITK